MKFPSARPATCRRKERARVFPDFGREVQVWRVDVRICASANACLHLGGPLECKDGAFVCPWQGARFDTTNGQRLDGPAPAGAGTHLMLPPTRIEGEELLYVWGETP
ncbi:MULTISPECIES: Rieske (2Fe-2S) protein [Alphaproteobacteria]|jgi:nitrite reductase/ring-hydroxylating ferredoxin subunit|uniref:Rieske (2Fe-2S) protein n=1 Tax=Alphaproteobacteria TaxID=28211 RepID=UPI000458D2CA|nr:hypothetical protein HY17_03065 [Hyphomonas sp. CY54-11-8]MBW3166973.1 Rieske (2Fe-2S) protein [Qipengyuania flava]MBY5964211.1 Rieske (2Fe-2S) protein [Qipengyuania flava]MBY6010535.1 Rieske (2Fe-2S) protein [Qipengyuania flava]MBY6024977.1 Rieske (2Fe-2S) protein [Qipengyuania flava]|tara:strand:- start:56159 stop:56479 length:321 start_codon:yes stop_codon:yes gene_type:complete